MRSLRVVLLLVVAAAVFAVVSLRSSSPSFADCRDLPTREATERCLVDALAGTGSLSRASVALAAELAEDESLMLACHEAAHAAGQRLYGNAEQVSAFLADPAAGTCEWGLVHGLLSSLVADTPSPDVVTSLLGVCPGLPDAGAQQACGDSLGHALWELDRSFPASVSRCLAAPSPVGDACVSGVFMQLYRPVAPSAVTEAVWSPPLARPEVLELCRDLDGDRAVEACAAAAHYAFAPDLQAARDAVLTEDDPVSAARATFTPLLEEGRAFCAGFPGAGSGRCTMELSRYALQMLRYLPASEVTEMVCGPLPAGPVLTHCRNAAEAVL